MIYYIIIIVCIVIVLGLIFLPRGKDNPSDYVEPTFKASGKKWVFNGLLDIDNPPLDNSPFIDYEGKVEISVKKGYVHFSMIINTDHADKFLGLFHAAALEEGESIAVRKGSHVIGWLPKGQTQLAQMISESGNHTDAYGFIARKGQDYYGEVCVRKPSSKE